MKWKKICSFTQNKKIPLKSIPYAVLLHLKEVVENVSLQQQSNLGFNVYTLLLQVILSTPSLSTLARVRIKFHGGYTISNNNV